VTATAWCATPVGCSTTPPAVGSYLTHFGLSNDVDQPLSLVEIGSGIGRMTAGFTRRFQHVTACDLDAAFLERCRQTVAQFGRPDRLGTSHVADGRTLALPDASADMVFSYITLQHCIEEDALALTAEALRVVKPGGTVCLNFRTWVPADLLLFPAGVVTRSMRAKVLRSSRVPQSVAPQSARLVTRARRRGATRRATIATREQEPLVANSQAFALATAITCRPCA